MQVMFSPGYLKTWCVDLTWIGPVNLQPDELYKFHKLSFVTSSLALKAAAAGSEQSVSESAARKKSEAAVLEEERRFRASFESPETARALAAAASYLQSNPSGAGRGVDEAAAATVASAYIRRGVESQLSPASTSSTIMVPKAERGGDQEPEANARSCSSPCEWFVCDEEETATRIFAIQVSIVEQLNKSCSEENLRSCFNGFRNRIRSHHPTSHCAGI